jgi:acetyl/propionyl-CoA carboxylase alpha subunit
MTPGHYVLRDEDRAHDARVLADGRIESGGRMWSVEPGPGGRWLISGPDGQVLARAIADGDVVWVHVGGDVYTFEVALADGTTRIRARHGGDLSAPMPAVVRSVLVSAGDQVAAGDVLLVLEAMKMELPVRAPRAGVVQTIACRPGDLVQPGVPLVELA